MMIYIRELEEAKYSQGGLPDRQRLTAARQDLDKVLSVRPCLRTHLELAQVKMQISSEQHVHQHQDVQRLWLSLRCSTTWA